jgi:tRNA(Ile2) C34 agmatinyltransferase TiaS
MPETPILCPKCGKLANWVMHHQEYRCEKCPWRASTSPGHGRTDSGTTPETKASTMEAPC